MESRVIESFLKVRDGRSADAVIADPDLNALFVASCRQRGLQQLAKELNWCLYNLRKTGALQAYSTTKYTRPRQRDDYLFACEIAARSLEDREHTTVDRILCDPELASQFDDLVQQLAPGHSIRDYRFTALTLRKCRKLRPEPIASFVNPTVIGPLAAERIDFDVIPSAAGVYLLYTGTERYLYIGEAENLKRRIQKHLDHSDRKQLAQWLWRQGYSSLFIELHVLPSGTSTRQRKAYENALIKSRQPLFNIQGVP